MNVKQFHGQQIVPLVITVAVGCPGGDACKQQVIERLISALQSGLQFASITSGTTNSNGDYQRDYLLTMELLDIHTGESLKDSAMLRKGYHKSLLGKLKHYND